MTALTDLKNKQIVYLRWSVVQQSCLCLILLFAITQIALSQTINVSGKVTTTDTTPVRYASVTFIDQSDTSKKYFATTDTAGNYQISIITSVKEKPITQPIKIELEQNYPNPFSNATTIQYATKQPADVKITIYDILGREVRKYSIGYQNLGKHDIVWDGKNEIGEKVATGIYFYRLQTEKETLIKKMVYLGNMQGVAIPISSKVPPKFITRKEYEYAPTLTNSRKFTIRINNTENTEPQIELATEENIMITKDTVINIKVLDATPGVWHYLGLGSEDVTAIAVHPTNPQIIYVGSAYDFSAGKLGYLFKTTNSGLSWDTLISGGSYIDIVIDPLYSDIVYAVPFSLLKSTNGGLTWQPIMNGIRIDWETRVQSFALDPNNTNIMYAGTGGFFGGSFYKSTNSGESWRDIARGDTLTEGVISIAIDPNNSNVVYAGTTGWGRQLWKTTDAGETWTSTGLSETGQMIYDILIHPTNSQIIFAGISEIGVRKTVDGGSTWIPYNEGLIDSHKSAMKLIMQSKDSEIFAIYSIPDNPGSMIWDIGGIYKRHINDYTWLKIGIEDLRAYYYSDIELSVSENTLYFGSKGLYYLKQK